MKIVFTALGTRGDVHGPLAAAIELQRRGHDVLMVAPEDYESFVEGAGVAFEPLIESVAEIIKGPKGLGEILISACAKADELLDRVVRATRGADLVVAAGPHPCGFSAAELAGCPYAYWALAPVYLPSDFHGLMGSRVWPLHALNRLHWRIAELGYQIAFGSEANRARARHGLAPVKSLLRSIGLSGHVIFSSDPEFEPIGEDIRAAGPAVGPVVYAPESDLDDTIEEFLAAGAPPLFIGFGSLPRMSPVEFVDSARKLARSLGVRVILATGRTEVLEGDVATVGKISHARLLPKTAGAVHHGGAGHTYAAARAGIPQCILAHQGDQAWYGRCVTRGGVGPPFRRVRRLSYSHLAEAAEDLLRERSKYVAPARILSERLARMNPTRDAADALERFAARSA